MKTKPILIILSFLLGFFSYTAHSSAQVKVIETESDLPGKICSIWKQGDYLFNDGQYLALIGNSSRTLRLSYGNYPTDDALGTLLCFIPAGKETPCNMNIGLPDLRLKENRRYLFYSIVEHTKNCLLYTSPSPRD